MGWPAWVGRGWGRGQRAAGPAEHPVFPPHSGRGPASGGGYWGGGERRPGAAPRGPSGGWGGGFCAPRSSAVWNPASARRRGAGGRGESRDAQTWGSFCGPQHLGNWDVVGVVVGVAVAVAVVAGSGVKTTWCLRRESQEKSSPSRMDCVRGRQPKHEGCGCMAPKCSLSWGKFYWKWGIRSSMRFLDRHPSVLALWRNGDREDNIEKEDGDGRLKLLRWLVPGLLCLSCVLMGIFVPVKFHLERLQVILELIRCSCTLAS